MIQENIILLTAPLQEVVIAFYTTKPMDWTCLARL